MSDTDSDIITTINPFLKPKRYRDQHDVIRSLRNLSDDALASLFEQGLRAAKTEDPDTDDGRRSAFLLELVKDEMDLRIEFPPEER